MDGWPSTRVETNAVRFQGTDTLVTSLGRYAHAVNSGWVRLMAPRTPRGAIFSPGSDLPLAIPARENLAFLVYSPQASYLPYLRGIYPGGALRRWTHPTEDLVVMTYRVSREQWASTQGALATTPSGLSQRVATLGQLPASPAQDMGPVRWTAGLRAPRYWNYAFLAGPGPARLTIDGKAVLTVPDGAGPSSATVALARGLHAVTYEAPWRRGGDPLLRWSSEPGSGGPTPAAPDWQPIRPEELTPGLTARQGLLGVVKIAGLPAQRRIDGTLATCCLSDQVNAWGKPYEAVWTGTLTAADSGDYGMGLFVSGTADLELDGRRVLRAEGDGSQESRTTIALTAGTHAVKLSLSVASGPGVLEWTWTPPGKSPSIVPPSALSPPAGSGIGPAAEASVLGASDSQPLRSPLSTIP